MQRCLELARHGEGYVAPNPMVGALLVYNDRIIAEGWHQQYGGPHAEVNAIRRAAQSGLTDLSESTLYVSLEPCVHHGKTPPCTDLIIQNKMKKVVIGCRDPFKEVDGKGIEKLKAAGIELEVGILEEKCKELNKRFLTFHSLHRPYIILKWAQTADGKIAPTPPEGEASPNPSQGGALDSSKDEVSFTQLGTKVPPSGGGGASPLGGFRGARLLISNEYSNRLVHKWRAEEAAILVGTNTALLDDPELTTRLWKGASPIRLVVDMDLKLPSSLKIFDQQVRTIIFNTVKHDQDGKLMHCQVKPNGNLVHQIVKALYQLNIQSVIVEGGAKLLQSFINEGIWDEVRTVTGCELRVTGGLDAPVLANVIKTEEHKISTDKIEIYKPKDTVTRLMTND